MGKMLVGKRLAEKEHLEEWTRAEVVSPLVSSSKALGTLGSGTCVIIFCVCIFIFLSRVFYFPFDIVQLLSRVVFLSVVTRKTSQGGNDDV